MPLKREVEATVQTLFQKKEEEEENKTRKKLFFLEEQQKTKKPQKKKARTKYFAPLFPTKKKRVFQVTKDG